MTDLLVIGVICDFVPNMLLLIFHYRNFSETKKMSEKETREQEGNSDENTLNYTQEQAQLNQSDSHSSSNLDEASVQLMIVYR